MPKPKLLIFDVNETLLDLAPLKVTVGKALGGEKNLVPLWFSTMLHYSLVHTLCDDYKSFGEIGVAALMMVAESHGFELDEQQAKEAVVPSLLSLPPHPDVAAGLKMLSGDGFRTVSLTNSAAAAAETQLRNAALTDLFEKRYSVEGVKRFKPHRDAYWMVLRDLGIESGEAMMVAAHAWDLAGAKRAGLQTAFISRPGTALYPNVAKPDYVVTDLIELARQLGDTA